MSPVELAADNEALKKKLVLAGEWLRERREELDAVRLRLERAEARLARARTCEHLEHTPPGTRLAYLLDGVVRVLGQPPEPEGDEESGHSCDAMGCGSCSHVVEMYRAVPL